MPFLSMENAAPPDKKNTFYTAYGTILHKFAKHGKIVFQR